MNIDWAALSRLVPEALMVLIVLVYVWQDGERKDKRDERRDLMFIQAMTDRDREWRDFMNVERTRQADGMAGLAHEMQSLASIVSATNQLIAEHDGWERRIFEYRSPNNG